MKLILQIIRTCLGAGLHHVQLVVVELGIRFGEQERYAEVSRSAASPTQAGSEVPQIRMPAKSLPLEARFGIIKLITTGSTQIHTAYLAQTHWSVGKGCHGA